MVMIQETTIQMKEDMKLSISLWESVEKVSVKLLNVKSSQQATEETMSVRLNE